MVFWLMNCLKCEKLVKEFHEFLRIKQNDALFGHWQRHLL